jgi:hypothetical protein
MDRRYHPRRGVRRPGQIDQGGSRALPCSIRNVSQQGAKIELPGARWIGYAFDLKDVMSGVARKCSVVWRQDLAVGIRFLDKAAWPEAKRPARTKPFGRRGQADG